MLHNVTPHVSISLATTAESAASSLSDSYEHPVSSLPSTDAESTACGSHHIAPESGNFLYNVLSVEEGQGNTVGMIVFVYSDQISTIISNKIR